ncbi:MAG: hypothetical protein V6Z81_09465 [Parvularculales bacterium]
MTHYLILASISLFLIDIVIASEIASWIALGLLTYVAVDYIGAPLEYSIPLYIAIYFLFMILYYMVWRRFVEPIIHSFIAPKKYTARQDALIGKFAEIVNIDGNYFAKVEGEVFRFETDEEVKEGESYRISDFDSNIITLRGKQ